ncbi:hypothetical protein PLICRDRAFT_677894 [Plicaturopsis crispa FD-325 SS-3]|nr:hypothetical protein PLICRDRAFT_677894 [Plicaturopsis crispa FD-325 SS-3]
MLDGTTGYADNWKVILLGDHFCGKTALITQFVVNCFVFDPTLEDYYRKQITVDGKKSFIETTDMAPRGTSGAERCGRSREGQAFILVYSVTSRATFDGLDILRQDVIRAKGATPVFMLVGTKCDLVSQREVSHDEGAQLGRTFGCEFVETSAKTGQNVDLLFSNVVRALRAADAAALQGGAAPGGKRRSVKCIIS